jgi:hypothetical protein
MLDTLAAFISETHSHSDSALTPPQQDAKAEKAEKAAAELKGALSKREKEKGRAMSEKEVRMETLHARLRVAFRDATPSPEDAKSVELIDELLQWQEYRLHGSRTALPPTAFSAR